MFQSTIRTIAFRGAALVLAAGTLGGATGVANAATAAGTTTATTTSTAKVHPHHAANPALVAIHKQIRHDEQQALLKTLNLTAKQLRQDRRAGESIATIAQGKQIPLATVSTALVAAAQNDMNQAVATGTLKATREQHLLSHLPTRLTKRLQATPKAHHARHATGTATTSTSTSTRAQ